MFYILYITISGNQQSGAVYSDRNSGLKFSNRRGSGSTTVIRIFNKMSRSSTTTSVIPDVGGQPHYSPTTGLVYIFNLIVGTGALTLPAAFHDVG